MTTTFPRDNPFPTFYKYPAHDMDYFLLMSSRSFSVLQTLLLHYGSNKDSNAYQLPLTYDLQPGARIDLEHFYKQSIIHDETFLTELVRGIPRPKFFNGPRLAEDESDPLRLPLGIELARDELAWWEIAAIRSILTDEGLTIRDVQYGSQEHAVWLGLVGD